MSKRHRRSNQQPQSPRQQPRAPRTRGALALADSSNPAQVTRLWTPAPMAGYGNNTQGDQQWGPGTSTGQTPAQQFFPNMPAVRDDKPLLTNIGASGTAIFSGVVTSEEYNPDFYWKDGIKIYEQMLRNDGQVNAVREIVEQPILRAEKHIVPGSSSARDQEIASFVETCLFEEMVYTSVDGISEVQTWDSLLRHILMHLWYGFMCFEQVWRIEDGWVKWARWTPLLPRTIWRWWVGNDNALTGVQQWTFREHNYQFVDIPAKKLVRFHRRLEGQNYEGVSALRSAYKHWFYKVQFEKIEAIGSERNAVIPAVIKLPEGFSQADYTNAQMIVANIRANESLGVTIPNTWDIEYLRNFQRQAVQLQDSIQYHDVMIARNMLAQFINLGSTETGAYSLDDSQRKDFLNNLQSICCSIEDTINLGPIRQLVDYNFDNVAVYPKLQFGKVLMSDLASLSDALSKLATAGFIHPDPQLEDYIREAGGLPSAPKSIVEAYNPTAPENASRPENANADNHQTQNPTQPQSQGTSNNGPDDGGDNGGGDGGGGGGMSLSESASASLREFRLLRESLDAFNAQVSADDAVERGVAYLFAGGGNPNHIPKGEPGAGQFAPGGAGGHGGEHSGHAVGAEHEGGHAPKSGGGGGGSGGGHKGGIRPRTTFADARPFTDEEFAHATLHEFTGGENTIYSFHLNGQSYVAKPSTRADLQGELAAREIAKAVGLGNVTVPTYEARRDGKSFVVTKMMPGDDLLDAPNVGGVFEHHLSTNMQARLLLHEYVIGDDDHHAGNYLYDRATGRIHSIDYGRAFNSAQRWMEEDGGRSALVRFGLHGQGRDFSPPKSEIARFTKAAPAILHIVRTRMGEHVVSSVAERLDVLREMEKEGHPTIASFVPEEFDESEFFDFSEHDDAVERGLTYLFAGGGNPNHIPKGEPGAGQFAPGGNGGHGGEHEGRSGGGRGRGGSGGAGGAEHEGRSRSSGSHASKGEHAPKASSTRSRGSGSKAKAEHEDMHAHSARLQKEHGLKPETSLKTVDELRDIHPINHVKGFSFDLSKGIDARMVAKAYGEHNTAAVLNGLNNESLHQSMAMAGLHPGRSRAENLSRLTAYATHGHYSANFGSRISQSTTTHNGMPKASKGEHEATTTHATPAAKSSTRSSSTRSSSSTRGKTETAKGERTLEQHTHDELKAMAKEQGVRPGKTKAETIANIRAKGEGKSGGKSGKSEIDKAAKLEPIGAGRMIARGNAAMAPNAHWLRGLYGDHQLAAALGRSSHEQLRLTAEGVGVKAGHSKAATISRIVKKVQEVPYEESVKIGNDAVSGMQH